MTTEWTFTYTLDEAIGELYAAEAAFDSGSHDERLRRSVIEHLRTLSAADFDALVAAYVAEHFLSPDARAYGYAEEDAEDFDEWVRKLVAEVSP